MSAVHREHEKTLEKSRVLVEKCSFLAVNVHEQLQLIVTEVFLFLVLGFQIGLNDCRPLFFGHAV